MSAIAQTQQAISRAVAQFATHGLFPAWDMASRLSCRRRSRFAACLDTAGATPWPGLGLLGRRVDAGACPAASTSARRTWELPARVIPPRDSVSPLERSEGASPHHAANDGARPERGGLFRPTLELTLGLAAAVHRVRVVLVGGGVVGLGELDRPRPPPVRLGLVRPAAAGRCILETAPTAQSTPSALGARQGWKPVGPLSYTALGDSNPRAHSATDAGS